MLQGKAQEIEDSTSKIRFQQPSANALVGERHNPRGKNRTLQISTEWSGQVRL